MLEIPETGPYIGACLDESQAVIAFWLQFLSIFGFGGVGNLYSGQLIPGFAQLFLGSFFWVFVIIRACMLYKKGKSDNKCCSPSSTACCGLCGLLKVFCCAVCIPCTIYKCAKSKTSRKVLIILTFCVLFYFGSVVWALHDAWYLYSKALDGDIDAPCS